ncbi:MAG: glutathione S-transferase [Rhizobiales bacterium PAR1]|nr:MAG: glutathione S-transferase [Rhizobiales bacterium PAR1]
MLTLYVFGSAFGLADPSPFVTKALVLLKMAGLAYKTAPADFKKAPKGKFPVLDDDGQLVPDSTLIRFNLEKKYGVDFDKGASAEAVAAAWAFEKLCEDHFYWFAVHDRWMIDENFNRGPAKFFEKAPALIRGIIIAMVRRKVRRNLFGQGSGRYTPEERLAIAARGLKALADYLGSRDFLGGDAPCGSDASVYATVSGMLTTHFTSAISDEARKYPSLAAYAARMQARYFPDLK